MRTFSIEYSVPGTCDCCNAALAIPQGGASPGTYKLEMPEGNAPTNVQFSEAASLTLGGGTLTVRLRQRRGSNRQWSLKPLYNRGAFARPRLDKEFPEQKGEFYFYIFSFDLPEFQPVIKTWWAELQFVEVAWGTRPEEVNRKLSHNSASLKVRLTRLD